MTTNELVEMLKAGKVEDWNKWRENNPKENIDLTGVSLTEADLTGVNLTRAHLDGVNLTRAHLDGADLTGAKLTGAKLTGAKLTRADLTATNLTRAVLFNADLTEADLIGANLTRAHLRGANGLRLDQTMIRNAVFSAWARDPWSTLRRSYTGPKFLLNLLFLVLFFAPYIGKTALWVGVNRTQEIVSTTTEPLRGQLTEIAASVEELALVEEDPNQQELYQSAAIVLDEVANDLSNLTKCLNVACEKVRVWQVVFGFDREPTYWLLALALLLYNICRGFLTWIVGPLRDEEERCDVSPAYAGIKGYGWLIWPHRVVQGLLFVAAVSFAVHAWDWMNLPVSIPQ